MSDLLFCTEQATVENLAREGIDAGRVLLVGNVMVDTLLDRGIMYKHKMNSSMFVCMTKNEH